MLINLIFINRRASQKGGEEVASGNRFDMERIKRSILLVSDIETLMHKSYVDRVPENFVKRDYIIDKIYDPRKSVEII